MSVYKKSIVASGHPLVSEAASGVLQAGGNAFDAVVAAGFASCVVEPALNSLGGGGLLLGHAAKRGQNLFFDFFVDTPGLKAKRCISEPHFFPVTVSFSGSTQDFNVGLASAAVPGTLKGLLHTHTRLGYMDIQDVLAPAIELARGHQLNKTQAYILKLLSPIMQLLPEGSAIYAPSGTLLTEGQMIGNLELANFLDGLTSGGADEFYSGSIAQQMVKEMEAGDGLITRNDLSSYAVQERSPISIPFRDYTLLTAPIPSMGGALVGLSMSLQSLCGLPQYAYGSGEYLLHTAGLMQEVERIREGGVLDAADLMDFLDAGDTGKSVQNIRLFSRGTTHISIADKEGNCASMTCSNGEGSGYFAPGTGVMLNNMMGEDDLHPNGFHSSPPGQRVGSMMSPSMLVKDHIVKLVIGSGGSKRIRTAITQVLGQVIDFKRSLQDAIDAPRLHWDGKQVQIEPGFSVDAVEQLKRKVAVNEWKTQGIYFGGVHAVIPGCEAAADARRGGAVCEVT